MFGYNTWEDMRKVQFRFKEIVQIDGVQTYRIHPWKQRVIKVVHDALCNDKRIAMLVLFGSSVNIRCTLESDLDFVIKLNDVNNRAKLEISERIQELTNWSSDILWFDRLSENDRVFQDAKKGVRII